ncbi:unnamed protein product, partial [Pylaiella littoralis]
QPVTLFQNGEFSSPVSLISCFTLFATKRLLTKYFLCCDASRNPRESLLGGHLYTSLRALYVSYCTYCTVFESIKVLWDYLPTRWCTLQTTLAYVDEVCSSEVKGSDLNGPMKRTNCLHNVYIHMIAPSMLGNF